MTQRHPLLLSNEWVSSAKATMQPHSGDGRGRHQGLKRKKAQRKGESSNGSNGRLHARGKDDGFKEEVVQLFLQARLAVMDKGVAASSSLRSASPLSEVNGGMGSQQIRGSPRVNAASHTEDFLIDGLSLGKWLSARGIQETLIRRTSDHWPIALDTNPFMWGPTPFRFENMWLQHPSFKENFRNWWRGFQGNGWEGHKFMRRLQFVKAKLKEWNKLSFGELNEKKKSILKDLANFDAIEQDGGLTSELLVKEP
ncbi:hypothetical protein CK203_082054 [Vitis vinifera]|uniref:Uncharacterized protein n=1 Tax=Vitis vinifera TaxID=29760 RepID=A0A438E2B6_VITVI|nr:hypothetical protein CK203_082054 [Vitis vinifera]